MIAHLSPSSMPHHSLFDPAAWLASFTAIGGGYALTPDRKLWLLVEACDDDELAICFAPLIGDPERQDAIKATIEQRQIGQAA